MRIRDLQALFGALIAISTLLLAATVFAWQMRYPEISKRDVQEWQPAQDFVPAPTLEAGSLPTLVQALARPVFHRSRKPFDPALAQALAPTPVASTTPPIVTPPPDYSQLAVKGIIISGATHLALISTPATPDGVWLALGAEAMGWKIVGLDSNGATIAAAGQTHALKLYVDNAPN